MRFLAIFHKFISFGGGLPSSDFPVNVLIEQLTGSALLETTTGEYLLETA